MKITKKTFLLSSAFFILVFLSGCSNSNPLSFGAEPSILKGRQGGTGIGSATAGDVGKALVVSDDSPFTYTLGSVSGATDRLTSVSSSAGKTLIFTHDGTDGTLSNTTGSLNLNFEGQSVNFFGDVDSTVLSAPTGEFELRSDADHLFLRAGQNGTTNAFAQIDMFPASPGSGGAFNMYAGSADTDGNGGPISISAGNAGSTTGSGGGFSFSAGSGGADGAGGGFTFAAGSSGNITGSLAGGFQFRAGNAMSGDHDGGDVFFQLGAKHGTGRNGLFQIASGNFLDANFLLDGLTDNRDYTYPDESGTLALMGVANPLNDFIANGDLDMTWAGYGSEEITHGNFTGSASGWNLGSGWSYTSNHVVHASGSGTNILSQTGSLVEGGQYLITLTIGGTTGTVQIQFGDGDTTGNFSAGSGVQKIIGTWHDTGSTLKIQIIPSNTFNGTIDDVSMKFLNYRTVTVTDDPADGFSQGTDLHITGGSDVNGNKGGDVILSGGTSGGNMGKVKVVGDLSTSNIFPLADSTYDLGASTPLRWNNLYVNNLDSLSGELHLQGMFNGANSVGIGIVAGTFGSRHVDITNADAVLFHGTLLSGVGGIAFVGSPILDLSGGIITDLGAGGDSVIGFANDNSSSLNAVNNRPTDIWTPHIGAGRTPSMPATPSDLTLSTDGSASDLARLTFGSGADISTASFSSVDVLLDRTITKYNNISTVSNGIPAEYATVDLTGQTAAKTTTTLYTPAATGMYRISVYLQVTTAASISSVLGGSSGVVITYNDCDGNVAQSDTMALQSPAGTIVNFLNTNTTATNLAGDMVVCAKSGVAIQYAIGYTSAGTAMQYAAHLKLESL